MHSEIRHRIARHCAALVLASAAALCAAVQTNAARISDEHGNRGYDSAWQCDAAVNAGTAQFYTPNQNRLATKRAGEVDVKTIALRDLALARKAAERYGYPSSGYRLGACDQAGADLDGSQGLVGKWIAYAPDTKLYAFSDAAGVVMRVTLKPSDGSFAKGLPRPVGATASNAVSSWSTAADAALQRSLGATTVPHAETGFDPAATEQTSAQAGAASACYATVVTPPQFEMRADTVVKVPATTRQEVVPGTFKDVEERVLVSPEYKRQIPLPATYKTVYDDVVVRPAGEREEPIPATYKTVQEQVLVKAASTRIEVTPATYKTVSEQVVETPETKAIRVIPATYRTEARQVIDRPASTRVETIPPTFKTVTERVLVTAETVRYEPIELPMRTVSEELLLSAATTRVEAGATTYRTVTERVLVKEATKQLVAVPAEYTTVTERVKVADASKEWKRGRAWLGNALQVSSLKKLKVGADGTVNGVPVEPTARARADAKRAKSAVGSSTGSAVSSDADDDVVCLVEVPERYETLTRQVLKTPAAVREVEVPAEYAMVTRQVVDRPASARTLEVAATHQTVTREVIDLEKLKSLGYKFDDKGDPVASPSGARVLRAASVPGWSAAGATAQAAKPAASSGAASGLEGYVVEAIVPAVYRDVARTVEATPATVRTVSVPATYKTVSVRMEATPERTEEVVVPATYKTVTRQVVDRPASTREVAIPAEYATVERRVVETPGSTRKVPMPAVTERVTRRVIDVPASVREETVPAVYKTVTRRVVDQPATVRDVVVPAVTETIVNRVKVSEATSSRREVLCETNATPRKILELQRALKDSGFDPGPIDGRIGPNMVEALTRYQQAKRLPVDDGRVINLETVKALGITPQ